MFIPPRLRLEYIFFLLSFAGSLNAASRAIQKHVTAQSKIVRKQIKERM